MSRAFYLQAQDLAPEHHGKCYAKCEMREGCMVKCMNLKGIGNKPCEVVVHVKCLSNIKPDYVSYLRNYFCNVCCQSDPQLANEMVKIIKEAQDNAMKEMQSSSGLNENEVVSKETAEKLKEELEKTTDNLMQQIEETELLEEKLEAKEKEAESLRRELERLRKESWRTLSDPNVSGTSSSTTSFADTFMTASNDTIHAAINATARFQARRQRNQLSSTTVNGRNVTFNISQEQSNASESRLDATAHYPNYNVQERRANEMSEMALSLLRSSIAKPQPFTGDITTWAMFLAEFKRTSARGHFRALEDMDRLRDLIQGEAREMFNTELSDQFAEPQSILMRLNDFYGVKGDAVRVTLDRIAAMQKVDKTSNKTQLKVLYTIAKQFVYQCRSHDQEGEVSSRAAIMLLESKLHPDHVRNWRSWARDNGTIENIDGIISFLEEKIRELNINPARSSAHSQASVNVHVTDDTGGQAQSSSTMNNEKSASTNAQSERESRRKRREKRLARIECFKCKEHHPFWKCPELIKTAANARAQMVDKLNVCTRCLSSVKHKASSCPNKLLACYVPECKVQNKHPLLHGHPDEKIKRYVDVAHQHVMNVQSKRLTSHYAMVPGEVVAGNGKKIPVTAMYDIGSGITLATSSIYEEGEYTCSEQYELTMKWTSGIVSTETSAKKFDLKFLPQGHNEIVTLKDVTAVKDEMLDLPAQQQQADEIKEMFPHLAEVPLPSYEMQKPKILLGLPHASLMAHLKCVVGKNEDDPVAAYTKLGWTLFGNRPNSINCHLIEPQQTIGYSGVQSSSEEISNEALLEHIRFYHSIESMGIAHKDATLMSVDDQKAEMIINDTMKFIPEKKRYEVGLLWKDINCKMPDNYEQAVTRLIASENRLKKIKQADTVKKQFQDQIAVGWLVEITREEADKFPRRNYVYGFLTFNQNKNKVRWVNDTAAKFKGVSLNCMLYKGPDNLIKLQQSICAAREGRIAYQMDVKSMFNQILLKHEDQYSQLCLWRDCDSGQAPRIYRQTRVIFGPTSSPAVANAVRIQHANNYALEFPEASEVALHQMYVDDVADSRDSVEEAEKVANDLINMFDKIGWPLVECYSNSNELLKRIPQDRVGKKFLEIGDGSELVTKVLGLFWLPIEDVYVFRLNDDTLVKKCLNEDYNPTKKEMLGILMRIFDPIGPSIPFRIKGLIIMQNVWKAGTDWKKPPPPEISEEFKHWLKDFNKVTQLRLPRAYADVSLKNCKLSLHLFVDAGTDAYAAAIYIRIESDTNVFVRLIAAKGRVAPLKYVSIPKLELTSGVLGARLLTSVKSWHRRLKFEEYWCWTDSITSYRWIKSPHLPRTSFSAPRISEIQESTSVDRWMYVPSKQNVADYGTKQREMDYGDVTHEWYTGPQFLYSPEDQWPQQPASQMERIGGEQASSQVLFIMKFSGSKPWQKGITSGVSAAVRSDWNLHVKVVALALRFADRISKTHPRNKQSGMITSHERERAENYIIRCVQQAMYPEEFMRLQKGKKVQQSSKIHSLTPFLCQQTGLIRATTRLSTNFPYNMRAPPIMPNFHETSDAIASYYHENNNHVGDNTIINAIRSRVWIISARRIVRRTRARCTKCIEARSKPKPPDHSYLPDFRLDVANKAFYHTGCDLFGPYEVYVGRSKHKKTIYVVIFTCMVTRAVYFETLEDMSTECFMSALDKLWSRRGPIAHIYCDNGRNFCGAATIIENDQFQKALGEKRITFHFNPPYTPQFGGTWERLIKDTKRALDASVGKFTVPQMNFEAALARIETNMNNRPLTDMPIKPDDDTPWTPYLLMQGYPNYPLLDEGVSLLTADDEKSKSTKVAKRINSVVQAYRSKFFQDYVHAITKASKSKEKAKYKLKEGDVVIYIDPTKNPSEWQKGIVHKTYPGKDNKVRVMDIKLKSGEIIPRRSAYRLAKVDVRLEDPEAESENYSKEGNVEENNDHEQIQINGTEKTSAEAEETQSKNARDKNKNISKMKKLIFDDDIAPEKHIQEVNMLTDDEYNEFIDTNNERTVIIENIPFSLGASEIYQIAATFGQIKTITCSTFDGVRNFRVLITYQESSSVAQAATYNESMLIIIEGIAHTTKICRPYRNLCTLRTMRKPKKIFVQMKSKTKEEPDKVLIITMSRTSKRCDRTTLPVTTNKYGFVYMCHPAYKFTSASIAVSMENGAEAAQKIPTIPKDENNKSTAVNVVDVTSSHSTSQAQTTSNVREDYDDCISIDLAEDPFEDEDSAQDLSGPDDVPKRMRIEKNEITGARTVIYKPRKCPQSIRQRRNLLDSPQVWGDHVK